MKKIISILLLIVLIFSLSGCKKSNNTSSELDTGFQNDISIVGTSSQNNTTSNEDLESGQSSSEEEIKPQSSSESSSKDENSTPSTPTHTHSFSNATCTEPKKCSCGATDGQALGHKWIDATCKAPKTCSVCKTTEGNNGGHKFSDGNCIYCQEMQIINPKEGLKEHADYYHLESINDGYHMLHIWQFHDNQLCLKIDGWGVYSTNKDWADHDGVITYKGMTFYPMGHGGPLPQYKLTDKEIILKYDPEEFADMPEYVDFERRLIVNHEYDLEVVYANDDDFFFKKGEILDLVE